jgi:regulator of protease activity HflC (stomatin/prohibitin superfamily)
LLRGVLDEASGKWGIRVTRVEIKAIDPPRSVVDAMEKQMRAEREKRAAILNAEGLKQSKILTAEGDKQSNILRAEGEKQSSILKAEGQAQAIGTVFQAVHHNDPDPKLLAWQYLQTLPQLAQGPGSTMWVIPSEVTSALKSFSSAFGNNQDASTASAQAPQAPQTPQPSQEAASVADDTPAAVSGPALSALPELPQVPDPRFGAPAAANGTNGEAPGTPDAPPPS